MKILLCNDWWLPYETAEQKNLAMFAEYLNNFRGASPGDALIRFKENMVRHLVWQEKFVANHNLLMTVPENEREHLLELATDRNHLVRLFRAPSETPATVNEYVYALRHRPAVQGERHPYDVLIDPESTLEELAALKVDGEYMTEKLVSLNHSYMLPTKIIDAPDDVDALFLSGHYPPSDGYLPVLQDAETVFFAAEQSQEERNRLEVDNMLRTINRSRMGSFVDMLKTELAKLDANAVELQHQLRILRADTNSGAEEDRWNHILEAVGLFPEKFDKEAIDECEDKLTDCRNLIDVSNITLTFYEMNEHNPNIANLSVPIANPPVSMTHPLFVDLLKDFLYDEDSLEFLSYKSFSGI